MAVSCGGSVHQVRWSGGSLLLDNHPDVAAEEVLVALGGRVPPCLSLRSLFLDAVGDGGFVGEWALREQPDPARTAWLATALERYRNEGVQEFLHGLPIGRLGRMGEALIELPGPLLDRAALTVAARIVNGEVEPDDYVAEHLDEAVRRRLRRAFVAGLARWAVPGGSAALTPLYCQVSDAGPRLHGQIAGRAGGVDIAVSRSWLTDVWGAGIATIEGCLVLSARPRTERADDLLVTLVRWRHTDSGLAPTTATRPARRLGAVWTLV